MLVFPKDASGRIVAYDLISGSMLGVLALDHSSASGGGQGREKRPGDGDAVHDGQGFVKNSCVPWTSGGDRIAVAVPAAEEVKAAT